MLKSKSFVKKTRKGGVLTVVREHYLRDDVWCGSQRCTICQHKDPVLDLRPANADVLYLNSDITSDDVQSETAIGPHYIVPDANVVLHQMDVLEHAAVKNAIVLQTVLEEVRHRSVPAYNRIRAVISDTTKRFFVFSNEHHRETYVEREEGESPNDRNDRAIRTAAAWYNRHVNEGADVRCHVLLLTDDRDNRAKAREHFDILAVSVADYARGHVATPELVDLLALGGGATWDDPQYRSDVACPEHLPLSAIQAGVKAGRLYQGTLQVNRDNPSEASLMTSAFDRPVLVQGFLAMNRAVQGDVVAVEILPREQWVRPTDIVLDDAVDVATAEASADTGAAGGAAGGDAATKPKEKAYRPEPPPPNTLVGGLGGRALAGKRKAEAIGAEDPRPTGRVVGIVRRNWRPYCGMLLASPAEHARIETDDGDAEGDGELRRWLFIPAERRVPRIRIQTRQGTELAGMRLVVAIDGWSRNSKYPHGHFVRSLGPIGDKATESEVLLIEHDVPHHAFPPKVLACLPRMPWIITDADRAARADFTDRDICSVDPPGCTDIDDALHCMPLPNGNYEVGVHIADVTHFVKPATAIDAEAADRGTTVYLTEKRIDMLPELLGTNLCSLMGNVERFAFSVLWEMTPDAHVVSTRFTKSVIRSRAAMTYEEAQMRIDDASRVDDVTQGLRRLNAVAKILKQRRIDKGALTLSSPEVRFELDAETHNPTDVTSKEMRETNSMVEEFMLLANVTVAAEIFRHYPQCSVLRRHPSPQQTAFDPLIRAASHKGISIATNDAKALAVSLDAAEVPGEPYFNTLIRMMATRSMMQAVYFCSGSLPERDFLHYGLACPIYTHFTSPIRRYADVMVHRLLAASLGVEPLPAQLLETNAVQRRCDTMNHRHRMAQYASRESGRIHALLFFRQHAIDEEGYIFRVKKNAVLVFVPKFGIESPVFIDEAAASGEHSLTFDGDKDCLRRADGSVAIALFDRVIVRLRVDDSDVQHAKLTMQLVQPCIPGLAVGGEGDGTVQPGNRDVPMGPAHVKCARAAEVDSEDPPVKRQKKEGKGKAVR